MIKNVSEITRGEWARITGVLLLWLLVSAYLIRSFGHHFAWGLVDSGLHTVLIVLGFLSLENIFKFYLPKQAIGWAGLVFPIILAALAVSSGSYLLGLLFKNEPAYLAFIDQSFWVKSLILWILFSSFTLVLVFREKKADQMKLFERTELMEKMSRDSELYHLRQQLKPHFLFNSLNSINALIGLNPEKAREMIVQLSDFMRETIRKDERKWVSVEEEIDYLQLYLNIEQVRFGHRLSVDFKIGENAKKLVLPQLLIQPLLENAIKHGLYGVIGDVNIALELRREGDYLEIAISNPYDPTGVGKKGEGFGLEAVKRRLYLLFGRHDLFHSVSKDSQFTAWLKIPQLHDQNHNH